MTATGPYVKVYQSIVDDPQFARVYGNDHALATWLRMLLIADAMWPASAPMTSRNPTVRLLIDVGLVLQRPGNRYSIRGLDAERERRSAYGRNAAAVRWQSERNAEVMPNRAEQSRTKQSIDATASKDEDRPAAFMGFRPKKTASLPDVMAQHNRDFDPCAKCGERRGGIAHAPGRSDHPFQEKAS